MSQDINASRRLFLRSASMALAATQFGELAFARSQSELSALDRSTTWFNSPPLTERALQGKVVLIDFWTYSCINWRRQLPYVRAWFEKYRSHGLVVVGAHSPEFSFERNADNVHWAVNDMRIPYPVVMDNDYSIWRAFNNEYWPALYFVDAQGRIRHHVFGEGQYDQSEVVIRGLLTEAGASGMGNDLVKVEAAGAEAGADWRELQSGENYVGYARTENFSSPGGIKADQPHVYAANAALRLNQWALSGDWTMGRDGIVLNQPDGRISYRFHARDLNFVIGPAASGKPIRFRVFLDGNPPGANHGVDVDEQGNGQVVEPRMYQMIRQRDAIQDRKFEIQFLDAGVEAFSFTFG